MDETASERSAKRPAADKPAPISPGWTATPAPDRAAKPASSSSEAATPPAHPAETAAPSTPPADVTAQTGDAAEVDAAQSSSTPEPAAAAQPVDSAPAAEVRLRAGDMDRRRVASVLHDALGKGQLTIDEFDDRTASAWGATYIDELDVLTRDLIPSRPGLDAAAHTPSRDIQPPASSRVTGDGGPSTSVAIFSGFERKGVWTVPSKFTAVAVMGGGVLDLRHANLGADKVTITVTAIMGGVEIIVPDDINVNVEGFGFMGAFDDSRQWERGVPQPDPSAPTVTVNGLALMGGVSVTRKPSGPVSR
ncbi:DUF1707 SHOCT-like domain-containing protein [Cumulibacter soli]|uniref:DUF1707 SHOCT-like domain-containing protein n=1 Tax=Cumulibacter soli TaxID=2546344 RepID=UPI0010673417|nr:DUF1707 domain-containing protein [Cumulibacter soli]